MSSQRSDGQEPQSHIPGIAGRFQQLKADSAATAAEISEFLASMRGKSPQEMLGTIAKSQLVLCTLAATGIVFVLLVVFTAIPYYFPGSSAAKKDPPAAQPAPQPAATANATPAAGQPATDKPADGQPSDDVKKGLPKVLGIDEKKMADPNKNPLEGDKALDKLLDDLD